MKTLHEALDNLDAAVAFRRKITEASKAGEDTTSTGAYRDALEWLHEAAFEVSDARAREPK